MLDEHIQKYSIVQDDYREKSNCKKHHIVNKAINWDIQLTGQFFNYKKEKPGLNHRVAINLT